MQNRLLFVGALLFAEAFLPCESVAQEKGSAKAPPLAVAPFTAAAAREHQEAWAKHIGQPREVTNSIGMKLVLIPPGEFKMGSQESAEELAKALKHYGATGPERFKGEYPRHRVRITKPFYLGAHEVTHGQFRKFVEDTSYRTDAERGDNEGLFGWKGAWGFDAQKGMLLWKDDGSWRNIGFEQTDNHPVVAVSWNDAIAFCKWLSRKEGKTYRLPTEAEWEYACRAGTTTRYYHGDDPEALVSVGNVADATARAKLPDWDWPIRATDGYAFTSPVGQFKPNAFGLYDMHGNAWEWCADWYDEKYYAASPVDDPTGPSSGTDRVFRGGSCHLGPNYCRSALRSWYRPYWRASGEGFRVARTN